jgi:flotillin
MEPILNSYLLAGGVNGGAIALVVIVVVTLFILIGWLFANRYRKVGPNQALIIYGRKSTPDGKRGFRIVKGGGTFILPVLERYEVLSLELITIDVKTPEVYTVAGVPVLVDGVAQIKVNSDYESMAAAAEQFLGKGRPEIENIALQTLEGHLRAILGTLTVEQIYKDRESFAQQVQEVAAADMRKMGLHIVSFTLKDIRDEQGYLDALGKPRIAMVKRDAVIGQAEADRDATVKSAQAYQTGQEAKFVADTKIAEAQRNYEVKKAEYDASVNQQRAQADLAYDLQKFTTGQAVKAQEIQVEVVNKEKQIDVQEKEISRKEKELEATVRKPVEAEQYRIQTLADAQKYRTIAEAEGEANARKNIGIGEAEATKAKGLAEAAVIEAKGTAESIAMNKKADAWRQYNEAAITQMFIDKMPELARAIAEPLSKTEKIIIINSGGDGGGVSKLTKDIADAMAQIPPTIEAISGIKLGDLLGRIPGIGKGKQSSKEA